MRPQPAVNAFALKIAAIAGMTCNHVANVFGADMPEAPTVALYMVGGLTFPIMAYLLCEGYRHTSSVRRYAERLALFAAISQVPYSLLFGGQGNVLITLLIGLGLLRVLDCGSNALAKGAAVVGGVGLSVFCDWGIVGPLLIVLFWHLQDRPRGSALAMTAAALGLGIPALSQAVSDPTPVALGALGYYTIGFGAATLLILNYNGQRGRPMKWFFYGYYPAHLLALWALALLL